MVVRVVLGVSPCQKGLRGLPCYGDLVVDTETVFKGRMSRRMDNWFEDEGVLSSVNGKRGTLVRTGRESLYGRPESSREPPERNHQRKRYTERGTLTLEELLSLVTE